MGFESASGVVLNRRVTGEGDLNLTLFLKGLGVVYASAKGAAGGKVRFGGATEPLVWGAFALYRPRDGGGRLYLKSVDVADDMLSLRSRPEALFAAARWSRLLTRYLMEGHADDGLLANFYWNMKLLCGGLPPEAVEWRFMRKWLKAWGLAPEIPDCATGTASELELLHFVSAARTSELESFERRDVLESKRRLFADASRRAETFLIEV
ncbi:MAG: recombination protein O N-terminal domain-containing protein [Synergistaceae bacterium]|nr:recombination protein O N-terminal domain-containing protein [Synergistaceae bacterium]